MSSRLIPIVAAIVGLVIGITFGVLIGWFSKPTDDLPESYKNAISDEDPAISENLLAAMNPENIRKTLKYLTSEPHVAGTPQSYEQAEWVRDTWIKQGLDTAEIKAYKVLLSYPSDVEGEENRVQLLNNDGTLEFECQLKEAPLDQWGNNSAILPPFNAYSARGEIEGDLVYANYGRVEDFFYLTRDLNITVKDMIVIVRYGKIYRGDKANNAANFGAKGLIMYSDPADYFIEGGDVYPNGIYLPGTGTQRGTTFKESGDPVTPGYPATDFAYRIPEANLTTLPTIPVHPIGYDDATEFLRRMGGDAVKPEWRGSLKGVTYRYGPGFDTPDIDKRVAMKIYTHNQMAYGWDVIGTLKGDVEPDRYVIIGNHRDAWGFGAIDPSSGTSSMMEISSAFGQMKEKHGWRPRRTLMFGSWGAEEFGLIGSYEWNEEFSKSLYDRAVAYMNIDISVSGTYVVDVADTPNLSKAIYAAAKKVKDPAPEGNRRTMYDTWVERSETNQDGTPHISTLGSGSDYAAFLQLGGISAMDMSYVHDKKAYPVASYPCYHSVYETFYLVETYYDPKFVYHLAAAQFIAELARDLADSLILPMDANDYAAAVKGYSENLIAGDIGQRMILQGLSFAGMESAVGNFTTAAADFHNRLNDVDITDVLQVRLFNDQLQKLERAFTDPLGLPDRPLTRHIIFAPSSKNSYASDKFPGIVDAMFDIDDNPDPNKWELVEQQLAVATFTIQSAASTLMKVA